MKNLTLAGLISRELTEKLTSVGMMRDTIFTPEKMIEADRLFLDISSNGQQISYITKERLDRFGCVVDEDGNITDAGDVWGLELRKRFAIQTRPGRVIQTINGTELPYADQRKLKLMLFDGTNYEVQIKTGTDVQKYYNSDFYDEQRGDIMSCMSECPSSFFEIYKKYAKLVVVMNKTTNKIVARSVMFEGCKSASGMEDKDLMCRIYASDDIFYDMLRNWGVENGKWIFNGGYSASQFIVGHDAFFPISDYKPYFVTERYINDEFSFLPYMDNFEYSVKYDGEYVISPSVRIPFDGRYDTYESNQSTGGGYGYGSPYDYCEGCDGVCAECYKENHGCWGDDDDCDW